MSYPLKKLHKCKVGSETVICDFVNLYECTIGNRCLIGTFVEIQKKVFIGNNVRIQSHSFICEGVVIEDNVFIGHHVVFTNDKYPRSTNPDGSLKKPSDWNLENVHVKKGASIGSNATIVGPVTIGEDAMVGAGSVVIKDVPKHSVVVGNPARPLKSSKREHYP